MIKERIRRVKRVYEKIKDEVLGDSYVRGVIKELKEKIAERRDLMIRSGMSDICRRCEKEEGGSCCGRGIEEKFDEALLFINAILGCDIPEFREEERSCLFLGKDGCKLLVPHVICINYICEKIERGVRKEDLSKLREIEGDFINLTFKLHEYIVKKWIF